MSILQHNLFELKTRIIGTDVMLSSYLAYKKENEALKKEISSAKTNKSLITGDEKFIKYNLDLLQSKNDLLSRQLEEERYKNQQFGAAYEEKMSQPSKEMRIELVKLKKLLGEKDKEISDLRNRSLVNHDMYSKKHELAKKGQEDGPKEEFIQKVKIDELDGTGEALKNNHGDVNYKELIEENEFLKSKYQKFSSKYIKYKAKYQETKGFIDLIMKQKSIWNESCKTFAKQSIVDHEISFDLLKNKRNPNVCIEKTMIDENSKADHKKKGRNNRKIIEERESDQEEKSILLDDIKKEKLNSEKEEE